MNRVKNKYKICESEAITNGDFHFGSSRTRFKTKIEARFPIS